MVRVAADGLVEQAERLLAGEPVDDAVIDAGLAPLWRAPTLDTVVLGCTHFPLLRDRLNARAPRPLRAALCRVQCRVWRARLYVPSSSLHPLLIEPVFSNGNIWASWLL